MSSMSNCSLTFSRRSNNRYNLFIKIFTLLDIFSLVLRHYSMLVLFFSSNLPLFGHIFSCNTHVITVEGICQAVCDNGVLQRGFTHLHPVMQMNDMRSPSCFATAHPDRRGSRVERHGRFAPLYPSPPKILIILSLFPPTAVCLYRKQQKETPSARGGGRGGRKKRRRSIDPALSERRSGCRGVSCCLVAWAEFTMTNEEPLPKKARLSETDFKVLPREELILRWKQYEAYVQALEGKYTDLNSNDVTGLRESEEKLKQQQQESARRENILVMRLATKEQEMQECTNQIQYLKQVQQPSVAQLRSTMVDPAINLFFLKMKGELEQTKDKLEQAQNELSAWKFTPDSQTGKKLMAKCRMLIQENQELGRQLSQGRIAQLEAELALQKKYSEELKSSQDELNDFIIQLDEEVEGMQSTILVLQQQLKETRQQLVQYQQQQLQASTPGTSRTPSCEITDQGETMSKDCSRLANGPSNGSSSHQRTAGPGFYREGSGTEDDFPPSPSNGNKLSNHSEDRTGRGSGSYINQLSTGYESVDSPTGSENSLTHHSNDTDSNHDPQEEKTVSVKGNRTSGSRHVQNGLDSNVNVQGSVL